MNIFSEYLNPYYYWWKARKYFKRPKCHFEFHKDDFWFFGLPARTDYYNKIIDCEISGLGWKSKWETFRHEWNPYFVIVLLRKYYFVWMWTYGADTLKNISTWEAILEFLYNKRSIRWCVETLVWRSEQDKITIFDNLTNEGKRVYQEEYERYINDN